jgi:site-specific recombinase XerD
MERGLTTATVVNYLPIIHHFLLHRFVDGPLHIEALKSPDISTYILAHAHSQSVKRAQLMVTALRSFFRFLLLSAKIQVDLAACVPTVADWRSFVSGSAYSRITSDILLADTYSVGYSV